MAQTFLVVTVLLITAIRGRRTKRQEWETSTTTYIAWEVSASASLQRPLAWGLGSGGDFAVVEVCGGEDQGRAHWGQAGCPHGPSGGYVSRGSSRASLRSQELLPVWGRIGRERVTEIEMVLLWLDNNVDDCTIHIFIIYLFLHLLLYLYIYLFIIYSKYLLTYQSAHSSKTYLPFHLCIYLYISITLHYLTQIFSFYSFISFLFCYI